MSLASGGGSQHTGPNGVLGPLAGPWGAPLKGPGDWPQRSFLVPRAQLPQPCLPIIPPAIIPAALPFTSHLPCLISYEFDVNMPLGEIFPLSMPQLMQKRGLE